MNDFEQWKADNARRNEEATAERRAARTQPLPPADEPPFAWRAHPGAWDTKALATATEIALMWGQDRSQFVSRIQVAVLDAMRWTTPNHGEPNRAPETAEPPALSGEQIDEGQKAYSALAVPAWTSNRHRPALAAAMRIAFEKGRQA